MKVKIIFLDGRNVGMFENISGISSLGDSYLIIKPKHQISRDDFILSEAVPVGNSKYDFAIPREIISDFIATQ